jgi:LacI family transcriptional regulator, galactose operon repressor
MQRPPKGVTISDVAAKAGVSLSTVSRVLNGNTSVDPGLAERVRDAAAELNYTASPLARSLVLGRTQTVAVVVPDLGNPTFQAILRGLSRAAAADDYHVLIADSAESVDEERILAVETRRRTDGLILCAPRMPDDDLRALVAGVRPVVLINREADRDVPAVSADYRGALTALLEHLYELGHRALVYLAGIARSVSNAARLEAIEHFRGRHPGVVVHELPCGVDFDSGAAAAATVLASGATAVLAYNDLVAMGLLSAVQASGCRVPADLSIVGFDDIPFAAYTSPPLTTAAVPAAELGSRAWSAMRAMLEGAEPAEPVILRPRIVLRDSTGPSSAAS